MIRCSEPGLWALPLLAVLGAAPTARAHPDVDDGRARYAQADFEGALAAFERAERSPELTREDLIDVLEGRALAHYALEDLDGANDAVRRLASVDPHHRASDELPPELLRMFEAAAAQVGDGIALGVDSHRDGERVELTPVPSGDVMGLVRALVIAGRADGEWVVGDANGVTLDAPPDRTVEYYASALGPGAAVLASVGSERAPLRLEAPPSDEASGLPLWGWGLAGGGAALAIVVVIVAAVAASNPPASVRFEPPRLLP